MRLLTPSWWRLREARATPLTARLLRPVAWIWQAATARRIARGRSVDPGPPVICVGNLTLGGAGKTPVVGAVARLLADQGWGVHVLSRGHGGRSAGPLRARVGVHDAGEVGDEPLMLAAEFPAWVSRDRAAGARAAAAAGAEVIVMDDGHQNPWVKKALSLIVVDAETRDGEWPFGNEAVFPAGPMREPLAAGLGRADAVVLVLPADLAEPDPALVSLLEDRPVLIARLAPLAPPPPGPQVGFAGIGKPWKVARALRAAGCELVDFVALANHTQPSERTLQGLADRARAHSAGLITTEKDWVRLSPKWRERVTCWPAVVRFEDEAAARRLIETAIRGG